MKVAITNPTAWPYLRRGGERFVEDLSRYLVARGHEVTIITSKSGPTEVERLPGRTTIYYRRLWHPTLERVGLLNFHAFFLRCFPALLRTRFDVVHCCTFLDAYAAILARRITGTPCLFWVHSLRPPVRYFRSLTLGGAVFRRAVCDSDEVVCLSRYMQDALGKEYGRPGIQIPPGVDLDTFPLSHETERRGTVILCAAALDDERKGGRLLMRAFNRLKLVCPEAELHLSGQVSVGKREELLRLISPEWQGDIHFVDPAGNDLPALYGRATISVLPSLWEAFGLVLVEALAAGTPVVGTRNGAIPEIVSDPAVGRTFDPGSPDGAEPSNVEGLVQAMLEAIELARDPQTALRCRRHAERYSWSAVGPRFEEVFTTLAAGARPRYPIWEQAARRAQKSLRETP